MYLNRHVKGKEVFLKFGSNSKESSHDTVIVRVLLKNKIHVNRRMVQMDQKTLLSLSYNKLRRFDMSLLAVYDEEGRLLEVERDYEKISQRLASIGIRFERWEAKVELPWSAGQEEVLEAYKEDVERIVKEFGFKSIDVVSLTPEHPKKEELRNMFLSEHTHSDFEVRFFVDGCGTFYLHPGDKVYVVLCEKGDFISVPANTKHWFDMGTEPFFKAIRFFSIPDGWVANFTGSDISKKIPSHDQILKLR